MTPKISIIIPVYNAETYLYRCLASVISQTLSDIEVICVNDGSTDNSLSILYEYQKKDKRFKVITQNNMGLSCARNNALKYAQGKYIGFVDADDTIEKDFYLLLYNNAERYKAEIACGMISSSQSIRKTDIKNLTYQGKITVVKVSDINKTCKIPEIYFIVNKIYNRELLLSTGVDFSVGETFENVFESRVGLDKLGKLVIVPKAIYNYYGNNGRTV